MGDRRRVQGLMRERRTVIDRTRKAQPEPDYSEMALGETSRFMDGAAAKVSFNGGKIFFGTSALGVATKTVTLAVGINHVYVAHSFGDSFGTIEVSSTQPVSTVNEYRHHLISYTHTAPSSITRGTVHHVGSIFIPAAWGPS